MNVRLGDSIEINATHVRMEGIDQQSSGGTIRQRVSSELSQIGNKMTTENGGSIVNEVGDGGKLLQHSNQMDANNGTIVNRVLRKAQPFGFLAVLGVTADAITLWTTGQHFWNFLS